MQDSIFSKLETAATWIKDADNLLITAGAGLGVDSGLPDFRGNEGFWKAYPGLASAGIAFQDIANPQAFLRNPRQAWGFYGHRLSLYQSTVPHKGFSILKNWADSKNSSWVYTSNVDGHFQKSGFTNVVECHGSINVLQCLDNCRDATWNAQDFHPVVGVDGLLLSELPTCPHCGSRGRPNIMMFDDWDFCSVPYSGIEAQLKSWTKQVPNLVVIELGAGKAIPTVRNFGERLTYPSLHRRHKLVRINPRDYSISNDHQVGISMASLEALEALDSLIGADTEGL